MPLSSSPRDLLTLLEQGQAALERGDVEAARAALKSAAARAPSSSSNRDLLLLRAGVLCADEDVDGALAVIDEAIAAAPDDIALVAAKAFLLLDAAGDPVGALPLLEEVLAFAEEHEAQSPEEEDDLAALVIEVSLRLVDAELATGNVDDAVAAASGAVEIARGFDEEAAARCALARALLAGGEVDDAAGEIAAARDKDPDDAHLCVVAARIAVVRGDDEAADRDFARAAALDPHKKVPPRLSAPAFRAEVAAAIAALPEPLGGYVRSWDLVIAHRADVARLVAAARSPETPLLLEGPPRPLRSAGGDDPFAHKPTAATLFQRSVEVLCDDDAVKDVVTAIFIEVTSAFLGLAFDDDLTAFDDLDALDALDDGDDDDADDDGDGDADDDRKASR